MSESSSNWDGVERRHVRSRRAEDRSPIHPWRWRALIFWIIAFTAITFYAIRRIEHDSATVVQLQATNCGLEKFLLTARKTRWLAYAQKKNYADLTAVVGYEQLLNPYVNNHTSTGHCVIPHRLLIETRPIDDLR